MNVQPIAPAAETSSRAVDDHVRRGAPAERGSSVWREAVQQMNELDLRRRLESLPVIEQAKGVLMAYYRVDADVAFAILRRWSSIHNVKLRDLAARILEGAEDHSVDYAAEMDDSIVGDPLDRIRSLIDQLDAGRGGRPQERCV